MPKNDFQKILYVISLIIIGVFIGHFAASYSLWILLFNIPLIYIIYNSKID